jgi:hypothetical protein
MQSDWGGILGIGESRKYSELRMGARASGILSMKALLLGPQHEDLVSLILSEQKRADAEAGKALSQ